MKNNSVTIGVVMCIVCCVGALCIPSLFNTSSDMSSGWNPSNVYSDVITTDNNVFTEAELQSSPSMGTSITRVSTSSTRLFHHSPSAIAVSNWVQTSSSSNATNYTASSNANISKGATPSAGIYTSTGNQSSAQGGATSVISSSSLSTASINPSSAEAASMPARSAMTSRSGAPVASTMSNTAAMAASTPFSNSSLLATYQATNFGTGVRTGSTGLSGAMRVGGGSIADAWIEWLNEAHDGGDGTGIWIYDDADYYYYHYERLRAAFTDFYNHYSGTLLSGLTESEAWDLFLQWFAPKDEYGNSTTPSHIFRFPIGDGIGVLLFLSLLNIFFLYMHRREEAKKKETQPIEQE